MVAWQEQTKTAVPLLSPSPGQKDQVRHPCHCWRVQAFLRGG